MQAIFQQRGQIVQDWLTYPFEPCPIPRSTLTFQDLSNSPLYLLDEESDGPLPPAYEMNYPSDVGGADADNFRRYIVERDNPRHDWYGFTAPGVLVVENIKRQKTNPPRKDFSMSEVSMAIYNHRFDTDTLRPTTDTQIWDYDSPQYQKFLGTRLGKLTAYMLLGAFDRGSRRIARVVTWTNPSFGTPWVRFDIEVVSPCDIPLPSMEPPHPIELAETIDQAIGEGPSMLIGEILPPPAITNPFCDTTTGQTTAQEVYETHAVDDFLVLGNERVKTRIALKDSPTGSSKASETRNPYTSSNSLRPENERVQAPRALHKSQMGPSNTPTPDFTSGRLIINTRELESSSRSGTARRVREPAVAPSPDQPGRDFTDLSELGVPLVHLQVQDQLAGTEVSRPFIQVSTDHASDLRTRPGVDINSEDLESQAVADETRSTLYRLSQSSSQWQDTDHESTALQLALVKQPTVFFTPPEYPLGPNVPVDRECTDRGTEIKCRQELINPSDTGDSLIARPAPLHRVLPASHFLDLNSESTDEAEMVLSVPLSLKVIHESSRQIEVVCSSLAAFISPAPESTPDPGDQANAEVHHSSPAPPVASPSLMSVEQTDNTFELQDRPLWRVWNLWRLILVFFRFLLDPWRRITKTKTN